MGGDRQINIGGNAIGSVFVTGDHDKTDVSSTVNLTKVTLPPPDSVNILAELSAIRGILRDIGGIHQESAVQALDAAVEQSSKPAPDKHEVGTALQRALQLAKEGVSFAANIQKLAPHVLNAAAWLGSNWHGILPTVGLSI
jgi:hypothetical protein